MSEMTFVLRLILAAFAVYRLAILFSVDDGPVLFVERNAVEYLGIFKFIRRTLGRLAANAKPKGPAAIVFYSLAELISCPFCLGVWFALIAILPVYLPTLPGDLVLLWLGLAGAQTYLQRGGR